VEKNQVVFLPVLFHIAIFYSAKRMIPKEISYKFPFPDWTIKESGSVLHKSTQLPDDKTEH